MSLYDFLNPNFLIISSLLIGAVNLVAPLVVKNEKASCGFMLLISMCFLVNVVTVNLLFLKGVRTSFTLATFLNHYIIAFHLEALGLIFLDILSVLWIAALLYTPSYLQINNIGKRGRFLFFLNLSLLLGVLVALSANLLTMFIFYEMLTLSTAPLVGHEGGEKANKGLYRYLKILLISSLILFLPAILVIHDRVGHGNFTYRGFIEGHFTYTESFLLLLMFVFGISKTAIFPLHRWLPAAMVATYPVSALLHAVVVVKAGLFCIFKILTYVFGFSYLELLVVNFNWLVLLPAVTMIYSSIKALKLSNIKMILAYSTINQLSIALISAFTFTSKAMGAAILHMLSHSFSKICLFYAAGAMYSISKASQVEDLKGIATEMPRVSLIFVLGALSLIGVPPLAGFVSKLYIITAAARAENYLVAIIVAVSTVFTALYMIKMLLVIYSPTETPSGKRELYLPQAMISSLIFCSIGIILFFLLARFINHFLLYL